MQNGTDEREEIRAAAVGEDGSVVLAGYSYGNWSGASAGDTRNADFVAVKLDVDGKELWRWQVLIKPKLSCAM